MKNFQKAEFQCCSSFFPNPYNIGDLEFIRASPLKVKSKRGSSQTREAWHRKGFRLFWAWKIRRGQLGRPPVSEETRELIRAMSRENPLWGAPRTVNC
jgi:hypothetical protein